MFLGSSRIEGKLAKEKREKMEETEKWREETGRWGEGEKGEERREKEGMEVLVFFFFLRCSSPFANVKSTEHSNVTGERAESNRITDLSRCSDLLFLPFAFSLSSSLPFTLSPATDPS